MFFFRLDLDVEPLFAVMALYDGKAKRKVCASFFRLNSHDLAIVTLKQCYEAMPWVWKSLEYKAVIAVYRRAKAV